MKRPDPMGPELQDADDDKFGEPQGPWRNMALDWRAYALHLESQIKEITAANRFRIHERVWYCPPSSRSKTPAVVTGIKGQRVRIRVAGACSIRFTAVSPNSLKATKQGDGWTYLAHQLGVLDSA